MNEDEERYHGLRAPGQPLALSSQLSSQCSLRRSSCRNTCWVKGPSGFDDVTIECLGVVSGWQPVGADDEYQVTTVDLIRADIPNGSCANGRQAATSASPFGVVVWGLDSYSSYAYPAGGNAAKLTSATVPPVPR